MGRLKETGSVCTALSGVTESDSKMRRGVS